MIQLPNQREFDELKGFNEPLCLTIYAPFIQANSGINPNQIELKNLLRDGEQALLAAGMQPEDVKKTLRPAHKLLNNIKFMQADHDSLVLFIHPQHFHYYHFPNRNTPYLATVDKGFNLEPLEKAMLNNKQYYVLAISHNDISLYEGDHFTLKSIRLKDFPNNMRKTLNIDEYPHSRQLHTIAPASKGKGSEGYHEQYDVSKTDKAMLLQFFRRIDKRLHSFLQKEQLPLIIGGVGYLLPIYRKANTYPHLLHGSITGNLERASIASIQKKAWRLVSTVRLV